MLGIDGSSSIEQDTMTECELPKPLSGPFKVGPRRERFSLCHGGVVLHSRLAVESLQPGEVDHAVVGGVARAG